MLESQMVIWNVKKLAKEFSMSMHSVNKILRSIGAKRWTGNSGCNATKYYWDSKEAEE